MAAESKMGDKPANQRSQRHTCTQVGGACSSQCSSTCPTPRRIFCARRVFTSWLHTTQTREAGCQVTPLQTSRQNLQQRQGFLCVLVVLSGAARDDTNQVRRCTNTFQSSKIGRTWQRESWPFRRSGKAEGRSPDLTSQNQTSVADPLPKWKVKPGTQDAHKPNQTKLNQTERAHTYAKPHWPYNRAFVRLLQTDCDPQWYIYLDLWLEGTKVALQQSHEPRVNRVLLHHLSCLFTYRNEVQGARSKLWDDAYCFVLRLVT